MSLNISKKAGAQLDKLCSMLISSTGEKERARFFNKIWENIDRRRKIAEQMDY